MTTLLAVNCNDKKDFAIIQTWDLGETASDHPTVSSIRKQVTLSKNVAIETSPDIIKLINART